MFTGRFANLLPGHEVQHVQGLAWQDLRNGELINAAEEAGFDVVVTCDRNMSYQQNIRSRRISIMVLNSLFLKLEYVAPLAPKVQQLLDGGVPRGAFLEIYPPDPS